MISLPQHLRIPPPPAVVRATLRDLERIEKRYAFGGFTSAAGASNCGGANEMPGGGTTTTPSWIAVGTRDSTGTSGSTPGYGTNVAGDLFVMIIAGRITSVTTPSGWTLQGGPNDQSGRRVYIFTRDARSTGSESGTVSVTLSANSQTSTIHTFRDVATSSFVEDVTTGGSASNGSTLTAPDITAGGNNRLGLFVSADGTGVTYADDIAGESGGSWVLRDTFNNGVGSNSSYGLFTAALDSGGTISGGTSTLTNIDEHSVVGIAIKGV